MVGHSSSAAVRLLEAESWLLLVACLLSSVGHGLLRGALAYRPEEATALTTRFLWGEAVCSTVPRCLSLELVSKSVLVGADSLAVEPLPQAGSLLAPEA